MPQFNGCLRRRCHVVLTFSLLIVAAACSESTPNTPSDPDQTATTSSSSTTRVYDGKWRGTTAEGFSLGFTITEDHVRSFFIEFPEVAGSACIFGRDGFEISGSHNFDLAGKGGPVRIGDRFTIVSRAPMYVGSDEPSGFATGTSDFTLTGTLAGTTGEGTGNFAFSAGACAARTLVSWNITREP